MKRGGALGAGVLLVVVLGVALPVAAQGEAEVEDAVLVEGAEVFSTVCAGCHGPAGAGTSGVFPPLAGNSNVMDTEYVSGVIRNGLEGEIVVNGVTYDNVMPAQSLTDDEVTAVIAYIQGGFQLPAGAQAEAAPAGETAGTALPSITSTLYLLAFAAFAVLGLWVVGPYLAAPVGPDTPWLVAWGKSAIIVVYFVVATVIVPSVAIQTSTVSRLPRIAQDLVGSALWMLGLVIGLGLLWWAKHEKRI